MTASSEGAATDAEVYEYLENRFWVSNLILPRGRRVAREDEDYSIVRPPMLRGHELYALVASHEQISRILHEDSTELLRTLQAVLGDGVVRATTELRFFEFGILNQRTTVIARRGLLETLEEHVSKVVTERFGQVKLIANRFSGNRGPLNRTENALFGVPSLGGGLELVDSELFLYYANFFFPSTAARDSVLATELARSFESLVALPTVDETTVSVDWGFLAWVEPIGAQNRESHLLPLALASCHEVATEVSNIQCQEILRGIVKNTLNEPCTHEIRHLFAVNALLLSTVTEWRCVMTTPQRKLYEPAVETAGRLREKDERYAFLRAETFQAVESLQERAARTAGRTVQMLLLGLAILSLFSVVFDGTGFIRDGDATFQTVPLLGEGLQLLNSGAFRIGLALAVVAVAFWVLAFGQRHIRRT